MPQSQGTRFPASGSGIDLNMAMSEKGESAPQLIYRANTKNKAAPTAISAPTMIHSADQSELDAGSIIVKGRYSL
jgi:hypothetical protein